MIYLILAILSSSFVSIMMRVGEGKIKNSISFLSVNYGICILLSLLHTGDGFWMWEKEGIWGAVGLGSLNGFFYIFSLMLYQISVRQNGVVLSSVFMKLGILVPLVISILFFGEMPGISQTIGFTIAVAAIILLNGKGDRNGLGRINLLLLLVLVGCGCADSMAKIYEELGRPEFEEFFLIFTFVIAFLLSIVIVIQKKQTYTGKELLYGSLLGIPNYYSARFLLKALGEIDGVIAYPTFSVGTIAVVTVTGVLLFKETFTGRQLAAIAMILVSMVLLN